jgi:hypothetical protein
MTWPIAFIICFGMFLATFLFIYIKEYRREENIMKQMSKSQYGNSIPVMLIDQPAAPKKQKKVAAEQKPDKKKDMN